MNIAKLAVSGPFSFENLSLFLVRGRDDFDGSRFLPLDQAMEQKCVIVHETGTVGQLEVENLSDEWDLFVQAGDVVKGGRQDRTLGVDFVLPVKSGRVPVPSFCVESGRWHRRAGEQAESFSSSKSSLSSRRLRMAAKLSQSQSEVWQTVAETQQALSTSMQKEINAMMSPTSYQLSMEDTDLAERKVRYHEALAKVLDEAPDALGFAFAINGEINTADVYGSNTLFRRLSAKLLDAAIVEAIAESSRATPQPPEVTAEAVRDWIAAGETGEVSNQQDVPPRVHVETRRSTTSYRFDTHDRGLNDAVLHRNLVHS
ncbi:MAG TPA: DUF6569 family protein [Chthoniobacteraceae bacterium]|jgi:hypothetical protein|nr:DUF6569 family protein [Chthoniobacteraceae bacterium]